MHQAPKEMHCVAQLSAVKLKCAAVKYRNEAIRLEGGCHREGKEV